MRASLALQALLPRFAALIPEEAAAVAGAASTSAAPAAQPVGGLSARYKLPSPSVATAVGVAGQASPKALVRALLGKSYAHRQLSRAERLCLELRVSKQKVLWEVLVRGRVDNAQALLK